MVLIVIFMYKMLRCSHGVERTSYMLASALHLCLAIDVVLQVHQIVASTSHWDDL